MPHIKRLVHDVSAGASATAALLVPYLWLSSVLPSLLPLPKLQRNIPSAPLHETKLQKRPHLELAFQKPQALETKAPANVTPRFAF